MVKPTRNCIPALMLPAMAIMALENTGECIGTLQEAAAEALGLGKNVKVYSGAHDQYCASLGSSAVNPGDILVSTGTAWVIMGISERPVFSDTFISPCPHPCEGLYGNLASLAGLGGSLDWVREHLLPDLGYEDIDRLVFSRFAKNEKLFFIPWLSGAGYPVWNSEAAGGFIGMDFSVKPGDMALAVMEAAVFSVKTAVRDFAKNGFTPRRLTVMGGASRSVSWMALLAAAAGIPVYLTSVVDSCALGAAFIAARGENWFTRYGESFSAAGIKAVTNISPENNFYHAKYEHYIRALDLIQQIY